MSNNSVGSLLRIHREKIKALNNARDQKAINQKASDQKEFCLHNGYKFDDDTKDRLSEIIGEYSGHPIMDKISIAVNYHSNAYQKSMRSWYRKCKLKSNIAYLRGIFVDKKYVVCHFTINAAHYYINLVNETRMSPQELKVKAINGALGDEIILPREQFYVNTYQTCIPNSKRRKPREPFYCSCISHN